MPAWMVGLPVPLMYRCSPGWVSVLQQEEEQREEITLKPDSNADGCNHPGKYLGSWNMCDITAGHNYFWLFFWKSTLSHRFHHHQIQYFNTWRCRWLLCLDITDLCPHYLIIYYTLWSFPDYYFCSFLVWPLEGTVGLSYKLSRLVLVQI